MRHSRSKLAFFVVLMVILGVGCSRRAQGFAIPPGAVPSPEEFKENPALSALIDREGINTALSKDEALLHYKLDRIEEDEDGVGTCVGINTRIFSDGMAKPGSVYLVSFSEDRIEFLVKSVARFEGDTKQIVKQFVDSYGVPDVEQQGDGLLALSYFIRHKDRYLLFQPTLLPGTAGDAEMKYMVYDLTDNMQVVEKSGEGPIA